MKLRFKIQVLNMIMKNTLIVHYIIQMEYFIKNVMKNFNIYLIYKHQIYVQKNIMYIYIILMKIIEKYQYQDVIHLI